MLDGSTAKEVVRDYITRTLIHDPAYPLADDEPLLSSHLIDQAALVDLAAFIEETFGVHIDDAELTTENIETLSALITLLQSRLA
ncbi:hypothetical protein ACFLYO_11025 [Chloroflexota bacterium]